MRIVIEVIVERVEGKFASKGEVADRLVEAVESADLDGLGADGTSTYEITEASASY